MTQYPIGTSWVSLVTLTGERVRAPEPDVLGWNSDDRPSAGRLVHAEDRVEAARAYREVSQSGRAKGRWRLQRADGSWILADHDLEMVWDALSERYLVQVVSTLAQSVPPLGLRG